MPTSTPEAVFAAAQNAMSRGDWEAFFPCLDRSDLLRLVQAAIPPDASDEDYRALCREFGVAVVAQERIMALAEEIRLSGLVMAEEMKSQTGSPGFNQQQRSLHHRDLLKTLKKAFEAALKPVPDLAGFTARVERMRRARLGGGSVSSTLFVGDTLLDLAIDGKKAKAIRRHAGGWEEPIEFVLKDGRWYIKLLAKGARPS